MFEWITDPHAWLALGTLIILEIILGIDNIIFLSLSVAKLPLAQQNIARRLGLGGAMIMRLLLLASISWIIKLTTPLFTIFTHDISIRDLILLLGGLFLIWKSSTEILHDIMLKTQNRVVTPPTNKTNFIHVIGQITILDIVFSLDSVITAVGLSNHLFIMMTAVILAIVVMMFAARSIGDFINRHSSIKMLALAFLVLVGGTLFLEGFHIDIPKGYIYFALFFSIAVELLNLLQVRKQRLNKEQNE